MHTWEYAIILVDPATQTVVVNTTGEGGDAATAGNLAGAVGWEMVDNTSIAGQGVLSTFKRPTGTI